MVIQRNQQVSIWGWADPGEHVTIFFRSQHRTTAAGDDGRWRVLLDPVEAGGPFEMRISGKNSVTLRDVLVGEIWIASGQSNMWWPVRMAGNPQKEIAQANYPDIRLFTVKQTVSEKPLEDVEGKWTVTAPATVQDFSAVGYYFAREIYLRL